MTHLELPYGASQQVLLLFLPILTHPFREVCLSYKILVNPLDLFQQVIQESGSVLTCFEGALGPTNINFAYANKLCGITEDQWNARNYTHLKECLMKLNFSHNYLDFDKVRTHLTLLNFQKKVSNSRILGRRKRDLLEHGRRQLFHARRA